MKHGRISQGRAGTRGETSRRRALRELLGATLLVATTAWARIAVAAPDLPAPSYDNTFYAFVYDAPLGTDAD